MTDTFQFGNLSKKTRESRVSFLAKMGITNPGDYKVLARPNSIYKKFIASDTPTTESTRIFHIIGFLKSIGQTDLENKYRAFAQNIIRDAQAHVEDNRLESDPRASRYLPLQELREKLALYPDSIEKLLVSLYVDNPPQRNNFHSANVVTKESDIDPEKNNVVINSRGIVLVTDKYKTFPIYGRLRLKLDKETERLIRLLGFPILKEETFKSRLRTASIKIFGKPLTINDYRHIYEIHLQSSDEYKNMTVRERRQAHEDLKHGARAAATYHRV